MPQPPSAKQNEILALQSDITNEIHRDAGAIAQGVFGENKNHPDMTQISNQQLDDLYRQKYLANDRAWLQGEARRDPQQFLDVANRIGVVMPQSAPGAQPVVPDPNAFGKAVMANAPAAMAALSQPAVPVPPAAASPVPSLPAPSPPLPPPATMAPPAAPPVILGPNGQPLPPSGIGQPAQVM